MTSLSGIHVRLYLAITVLVIATVIAPVAPAGAAWFPDSRLTNSLGPSMTPPNNSWAVAGDDSGYVHVVWYDTRDGNAEVYYKMFDGAAWTPDQRLTDDAATSAFPSVAAFGGRIVHVVWHDIRDGNFEIYHKKFDGSAWSADERLTDAANTSWNPSVAIGPDSSVHVVWQDTRDGFTEVYYKKHDGISWGPDTRLTVAAYVSGAPCVAVDDSGHVHVAWHDVRYFNSKIYYKKHDGTSWGPDTRLTDEPEIAQKPCIAAGADGRLHIVWEDRRDGNYEIYYKQFDGVAWLADERLTEHTGMSQSPSVVVAPDGKIWVVWHDLRSPNFQIYSKQNSGGVWGPDVKMTFAAGHSENPSIAVAADSILHVVWQDERDGNKEIYWTRTYRPDLPDPVVSSVEPDSGYWGTVVHIDSITGSNFLFQASVWLERAGEPDVVAGDVIVHSSEKISCDLNLWGAAAGYWDLVVKNPDDKTDVLVNGFRVVGLPDLELLAIEPDSGMWASVVHIDSITGRGFHDSTSVWLEMEGQPDLIPKNVEIFPPDKITCDLELIEALPGYWDLIAAHPDGQADTLPEAFYVIGLEKPIVYSITPDVGLSGESVHISDLAGANFADPVQVWLEKESRPDIPASNITVESPARITCDIPLTLGESGFWDVVVQNPDGQADTLPGAFEILPGPWSEDEQLSTSGEGAMTSRPNGRCLAVDSADNVHVVWYDNRHATSEIYYKKYDGAAWGPDQRLTSEGLSADYPCVAVSPDNNVHVVWSEWTDTNYEIYYKMYDGVAWMGKVRLTIAPDDSRMPAIAADNAGNLHVVWYDARHGEWDVFYKKYDGAWSPDTMINESGDYNYAALPAVAVDESFNVHVAWYDSRHDQDEIYYRRFNGTLWEPEVRLSNGAAASWSPSIVTFGESVYVAWHDYRYSDYEILFRAYDGIAWGPEERVTNSEGISANTCLAVDACGYLHLVWHDDRDGNLEIYYNRHNGAYWTGDIRLTSAPGKSQRPFIGVTSTGRLHVIWQDERGGNLEIYHKTKDPDFASTMPGEGIVPVPGHNVRVVPNPMSSDGLIAFTLPARSDVSIAIYDITGRSVWGCRIGRAAEGPHQVAWDGIDRNGRPVSTGVYFVEVKSEGRTSSAKLLVLR